jgi:hypothetical protein
MFQWKQQTYKLSKNLTTNTQMSDYLRGVLLEEENLLDEKIKLVDMEFPNIDNYLDKVEGFKILSGLQNLKQKDCITLFRAFRFPTIKRMYEAVYDKGYTISNYEQERILSLYTNKDYIKKREKIKRDNWFWTQPQERVVNGLPVFALVNDAVQIHRAFRGEKDQVGIIAIHIPKKLVKEGIINFIANTAIDLSYEDPSRDVQVLDFLEKDSSFQIDYGALRARGVDLHEMYTPDLPLTMKEAGILKIKQEFFLLDIEEIDLESTFYKKIFQNTELLKKHRKFLYGFWGDQNVFGRGKTKYIPFRCRKITKKER